MGSRKMAKRVTDAEVHAEFLEKNEEADTLEVSVDLIDPGLYLGNLASAREVKTLRNLCISHILTVDLVPLSRSLLEQVDVVFKFVQLADIPKDDLVTHLPECNEFIRTAINGGGNVLVHCYFGVSRSAAVVIGYVMEKYSLCYEEAFLMVKTKRRFIGPNEGFVAQLKLFGHMGYSLNKGDPRYKQFRLKMAGQKLKQVKILPQLFADLVKPDPGLTRERPDPIVYRCKKCRRVVASQENIIPHLPKPVKVELAKKGMRPPPSKLTSLQNAENGQILMEKLRKLATQILEDQAPGQSCETEQGPSHHRRSPFERQQDVAGAVVDEHDPTQSCDSDEEQNEHADYGDEHMVDCVIAPRDAPDVCRLMWFVEPMVWMERVAHHTHGKLHCPKCRTKLGSFNWVCGCRCPCGQKVAPAFYLVPSKVEWSNIVQNVQVTV